MKFFLFNTDSGFYLGETFEEADRLEYVEGITAIAPPVYGRGQIPVFDRLRQTWAVMPIDGISRRQADPRTCNKERQQ